MDYVNSKAMMQKVMNLIYKRSAASDQDQGPIEGKRALPNAQIAEDTKRASLVGNRFFYQEKDPLVNNNNDYNQNFQRQNYQGNEIGIPIGRPIMPEYRNDNMYEGGNQVQRYRQSQAENDYGDFYDTNDLIYNVF